MTNSYERSYEQFLNLGAAWCPSWSQNAQGFHWNLVLTPPDATQIGSEEDYCLLLARRLEWHLWDWGERFGDEMGVDLSNPQALRRATLQLIESRLTTDQPLHVGMSDREIAAEILHSICLNHRSHLFPQGPPHFPITALDFDENRNFADCIRHEITLDGWLLQAVP